MTNTIYTFYGEGMHASCVQIAILSSTVSFGAWCSVARLGLRCVALYN